VPRSADTGFRTGCRRVGRKSAPKCRYPLPIRRLAFQAGGQLQRQSAWPVPLS
jgi:hypothetical protein